MTTPVGGTPPSTHTESPSSTLPTESPEEAKDPSFSERPPDDPLKKELEVLLRRCNASVLFARGCGKECAFVEDIAWSRLLDFLKKHPHLQGKMPEVTDRDDSNCVVQ